MLNVLLFSLGTSVLSSTLAVDDYQSSQFEEWIKKFSKRYADEDAKARAFSAFRGNAVIVNEINSAGLSWKASIMSKYADMTSEEFQSEMLMRQTLLVEDFNSVIKSKAISRIGRLPVEHNRNVAGIKTDATSFDWRDHGAVTKVADQGSAGTCWTFSTVGNIEGQYYLANNTLTEMSKEYIVDCDGSRDDEAGHADCGIFGGWPYLAYDFVINTKGIPTEEEYPYCCGSAQCYPCMKGPSSLCGPPRKYTGYAICGVCLGRCGSLLTIYDVLYIYIYIYIHSLPYLRQEHGRVRSPITLRVGGQHSFVGSD